MQDGSFVAILHGGSPLRGTGEWCPLGALPPAALFIGWRAEKSGALARPLVGLPPHTPFMGSPGRSSTHQDPHPLPLPPRTPRGGATALRSPLCYALQPLRHQLQAAGGGSSLRGLPWGRSWAKAYSLQGLGIPSAMLQESQDSAPHGRPLQSAPLAFCLPFVATL